MDETGCIQDGSHSEQGNSDVDQPPREQSDKKMARRRKPQAPVVDVTYRVVSGNGTTLAHVVDFHDAMAFLRKQPAGAKLYKSDGVLLAYNLRHRHSDMPAFFHPKRR